MRELGRVLSRLNALNSTPDDEELLDEIAALIAEKHAAKMKPLTDNQKNEPPKIKYKSNKERDFCEILES